MPDSPKLPDSPELPPHRQELISQRQEFPPQIQEFHPPKQDFQPLRTKFPSQRQIQPTPLPQHRPYEDTQNLEKLKQLESLLSNPDVNRQSMGGGEILRMILMESK